MAYDPSTLTALADQVQAAIDASGLPIALVTIVLLDGTLADTSIRSKLSDESTQSLLYEIARNYQ